MLRLEGGQKICRVLCEEIVGVRERIFFRHLFLSLEMSPDLLGDISRSTSHSYLHQSLQFPVCRYHCLGHSSPQIYLLIISPFADFTTSDIHLFPPSLFVSSLTDIIVKDFRLPQPIFQCSCRKFITFLSSTIHLLLQFP